MRAHIMWYVSRYSLRMELEAREVWNTLAVESRQYRSDQPLRLYAVAGDFPIPQGMPSIDVHRRGITVLSSLYSINDVTGIDFEVQAVLVIKKKPRHWLCWTCAVEWEASDFRHFVFVCHGGTHRSVGCSILLATLVYQKAVTVVTTNRTRRAAFERGMDCCQD